MWNRAGVTKSVHFAAAALLLSVVGCQNAADSDRDVSAANSSMLKVRTPHRPIKIAEGALLSYRPRVFNWDALEGTVAFEVAGGELPEGCVLDEATGEVVWTPTETQGPGTYNLEFACRSNDEPENTTAYQVELQVVEANVAPRLDAPVDVSAAAGSTLEHLLGLADDDFPGNRVSLELTAGPAGAGVDEIGKLVYWEIPADWQQPRAEITVTAHDDGVPPLSTSRTFVVTVTDIATPEPERDMPSDATERVPEVAVDLPPLPRPGEPIEPTELEFQLDPPVDAADVRLSLLLPHELRSLLKTRYLDDDDARLAIMLTDPFEADDVPGNLSEGIVATCELQDSKYVWTWAMTKDLDARGYQNNIRNGVLTVESKAGGAPRLVAMQKVVDVPAPTLDALLGNEELQIRLMAQDRVKKSISLEGLACAALIGDWKCDLESQTDGFSALLVHPKLNQRVNVGRGSGRMEFVEFGFRVTPFASEIAMELAAKPDPADTYKQMVGSRKSLISKQGDARRWQQKLATAEAQLTSARKMPERNRLERNSKVTKINQATANIQRAKARLNVLAVEIPAQQNVVATTEAQWAGIVAQLEPIRSCTITGELWRRIGDVRIPVLRLVPVEVEVAAE